MDGFRIVLVLNGEWNDHLKITEPNDQADPATLVNGFSFIFFCA